MNLSFIIGLVSGIGLIVYGIYGSSSGINQALKSFIDVPSMLITFGGAFSATFMSVPLKYLKDVPKNMRLLHRKDKIDLEQYIDAIVELAKEARLKGLLVLEEKVNSIELQDDFLKLCTMLIVDAIEPSKVRLQIENEINCIEIRHATTWSVFDKCAAFAPAFGMLGTLIGLINMLANMDPSGGADALGKGMSTALVTTFYGSLLGSLICTPISNRLKAMHEDEMVVKELIMEGVLSIQSGENPKYIEGKLKTYISYKDREQLMSNDEDQNGGKKKSKGKKNKKSQANNA